MSGYESDLDINDLNFIGDFPADNSIGGFGVTAGGNNNYTLVLDPPITSYRVGLALQVQFHEVNTGAAQLDVDGLGNVPIRKIEEDDLVELEPADLSTKPIYNLKYDGAVFQVELFAPNLTSLWNNKGLIDASAFPPFPPGKEGDAYTVSQGGIIGESNNGPGLLVEARDVIYCIADNNGGDYFDVQSSWNAIQANLDQATEAVPGIAHIATQQEVDDGNEHTSIVTPLSLAQKLVQLVASELQAGMVMRATQNEVDIGTEDTKYITPLSLAQKLVQLVASESQAGLVIRATQNEVDTGTEGTKYVTSLSLAQKLIQLIASESQAGLVTRATQNEVDTGAEDTKYITPLSLAQKLIQLVASESQPGMVMRATQNEVDLGTEDTKYVTPLSLDQKLIQLVASELQAGMVVRATQNEVDAGTEGTKYVTPLSLAQKLIQLVASESQPGLVIRATQSEVDTGTEGTKYVTSLSLAQKLIQLIASESQPGLVTRATQNEVDTGTEDTKYVTPLSLAQNLIQLVASESQAGMVTRATQSEVDTGTEDTKYVTPKTLDTWFDQQASSIQGSGKMYSNFETTIYPQTETTAETLIPPVFNLNAGTINYDEGIRMVIIGNFRNAGNSQPPPNKTFRVYLDDKLLLANDQVSNPVGRFKAEIVLYHLSPEMQKGWSTLQVDGYPCETSFFQHIHKDLTTQNVQFAMTVQTNTQGTKNLVSRLIWTIEKIPASDLVMPGVTQQAVINI